MLKSYKDKSKNKPYIIVEISDKIMVNIMKKVRQILNIDSLHKNNIMGENVTVAVLDTVDKVIREYTIILILGKE